MRKNLLLSMCCLLLSLATYPQASDLPYANEDSSGLWEGRDAKKEFDHFQKFRGSEDAGKILNAKLAFLGAWGAACKEDNSEKLESESSSGESESDSSESEDSNIFSDPQYELLTHHFPGSLLISDYQPGAMDYIQELTLRNANCSGTVKWADGFRPHFAMNLLEAYTSWKNFTTSLRNTIPSTFVNMPAGAGALFFGQRVIDGGNNKVKQEKDRPNFTFTFHPQDTRALILEPLSGTWTIIDPPAPENKALGLRWQGGDKAKLVVKIGDRTMEGQEALDFMKPYQY